MAVGRDRWFGGEMPRRAVHRNHSRGPHPVVEPAQVGFGRVSRNMHVGVRVSHELHTVLLQVGLHALADRAVVELSAAGMQRGNKPLCKATFCAFFALACRRAPVTELRPGEEEMESGRLTAARQRQVLHVQLEVMR